MATNRHPIDRKEFENIISQLGEAIDRDSVLEIFDAFDEDKSGTIDHTEFENIMRWYTKESFTDILQTLHRSVAARTQYPDAKLTNTGRKEYQRWYYSGSSMSVHVPRYQRWYQRWQQRW